MPTVATLPTSMCSSVCPNNSANVTCGGPGNGELYDTSVVAADVQAFNAKRPAGWQGESSYRCRSKLLLISRMLRQLRQQRDCRLNSQRVEDDGNEVYRGL
jgi:hypothetical protein